MKPSYHNTSHPSTRSRATPKLVRTANKNMNNTNRSGSHVTQWEEKWAKDVFFGMNVLHESGGVLRVGDTVDVLRVASRTTAAKKMQ